MSLAGVDAGADRARSGRCRLRSPRRWPAAPRPRSARTSGSGSPASPGPAAAPRRSRSGPSASRSARATGARLTRRLRLPGNRVRHPRPLDDRRHAPAAPGLLGEGAARVRGGGAAPRLSADERRRARPPVRRARAAGVRARHPGPVASVGAAREPRAAPRPASSTSTRRCASWARGRCREIDAIVAACGAWPASRWSSRALGEPVWLPRAPATGAGGRAGGPDRGACARCRPRCRSRS